MPLKTKSLTSIKRNLTKSDLTKCEKQLECTKFVLIYQISVVQKVAHVVLS